VLQRLLHYATTMPSAVPRWHCRDFSPRIHVAVNFGQS
jgi:hypothetical protein